MKEIEWTFLSPGFIAWDLGLALFVLSGLLFVIFALMASFI